MGTVVFLQGTFTFKKGCYAHYSILATLTTTYMTQQRHCYFIHPLQDSQTIVKTSKKTSRRLWMLPRITQAPTAMKTQSNARNHREERLLNQSRSNKKKKENKQTNSTSLNVMKHTAHLLPRITQAPTAMKTQPNARNHKEERLLNQSDRIKKRRKTNKQTQRNETHSTHAATHYASTYINENPVKCTQSQRRDWLPASIKFESKKKEKQ